MKITKVLVKVYTKDNREIEGTKYCDEDAQYGYYISKEILTEAKADGILNLEEMLDKGSGIAIPYESISYIQTTPLTMKED